MRFIDSVSRREATGLVAEVYEEVERDFALLRDPSGNSPFMAHSPHPELLAGFWMVLYETLIVDGDVARADKEAIAATVSRVNECPFCIDAHSLLSGVAGGGRDRDAVIAGEIDAIGSARRRELVAWAAATRDPRSELVREPPFGAAEAPEAIGTAVAFHYVNRVVDVLQGPARMDLGPRPLRRLTTPVVGRMAGKAMRRPHEPGRTLRLLPEADLPEDLSWTHASPTIAAAMARFAAAAERAGESIFSPPERACVRAALEAWDGSDPGLGGDWLKRALADLDPRSLPAARLALLVALAPYRVDDVTIDQFKRTRRSDRELIAAVAWAAFCAARRIGAWLDKGSKRQATAAAA